MSKATRADSLVIEPVIELLPSTLDAAGPSLLALGVDADWVRVRDLVDTVGATDALIEAAVRDRPARPLAELDPDDADEAVPLDYFLLCGITIGANGVVRAWPGCCADWGALRAVRRALERHEADEESLWLGHDAGAASITRVAPDAFVLRTQRANAAESQEWGVSSQQLCNRLDEAEEVLARFESLVLPRLDAELGAGVVVSWRRDRD